MNQSEMPRIMDHLNGINLAHFMFIKPSKGKELEPLLTTSSRTSPRTRILSAVMMALPPETIIPFHYHQKEKLYEMREAGLLDVVMVINGEPQKFTLEKTGSLLTIPPQTPHALICKSIDPCKIFVVASSQETEDCMWELELDELLKNKHRK